MGSRSEAAVSLALRIPEVETWVLGDAIPLSWEFTNGSDRPLGFMWEGCCRLNGRLDVSAADTGARLETVPPGQALAHMFARADQLEPGIGKPYETKISDWVGLPGSGRYRLQGTYRGVLPSQFPQVARGLALWKDAATSAPIEIAVLSVADYLAEREDRSRRGGLWVTLSGPARLSPREPTRFGVRLENRGSTERRLVWPDQAALWVVDSTGRRAAPSAVIRGATAGHLLPPGGTTEFEFEIEPDRWEGETFGPYSVFLDLAAGEGGAPRVPSNPLALEWRLGPDDVEALVREAARGSGTGYRNAALKRLRVHLGDVGTLLERLDRTRLDPEARGLADRLTLAWRVRPIGPRPGGVDLPVRLDRDGVARWGDPVLVAAFRSRGNAMVEQAAEVVAIRRHLGWDVTLVIRPELVTQVGRILEAARGMVGDDPTGWAGPAELRLPEVGTNAPVRLLLTGGAPGLLDAAVRKDSGGRWRLETVERSAGSGTPVASPLALGRGRVGVPPSMRWSELCGVLEPHRVAGARWELVAIDDAGGG
ncbi:MAG: hypothetical protein AB7O66_04340 [Limisphaerales bacterium]